jgi:CheY-like chemotaxis protein
MSRTGAKQLEWDGTMTRLVLIVDDSPQMAANLEIALMPLPGIEVAIAGCGREALRLIDAATLPLAAVITDIEMPRMDGFELIERLRADPRRLHLPIVVVSGSCDAETPERARRLGADAYFCKPFSPAELRNKLEVLLHEKQKV